MHKKWPGLSIESPVQENLLWFDYSTMCSALFQHLEVESCSEILFKDKPYESITKLQELISISYFMNALKKFNGGTGIKVLQLNNLLIKLSELEKLKIIVLLGGVYFFFFLFFFLLPKILKWPLTKLVFLSWIMEPGILPNDCRYKPGNVVEILRMTSYDLFIFKLCCYINIMLIFEQYGRSV